MRYNACKKIFVASMWFVHRHAMFIQSVESLVSYILFLYFIVSRPSRDGDGFTVNLVAPYASPIPLAKVV